MICLNSKNSESALLAEPHGAAMFSCRTLTLSAKVSCRTLEIAKPKALNLEKENLAEPWNAGSFRVCQVQFLAHIFGHKAILAGRARVCAGMCVCVCASLEAPRSRNLIRPPLPILGCTQRGSYCAKGRVSAF